MSVPFLTALSGRLLSAGSTGAGGWANVFGSRVFLDRAPADTLLPLCVYSLTVERSERTKAGYELIVSVVFSMYDSADSTTDLETAQSRLRTLLDGYSTTATNHDRMIVKLRRQGILVQDDGAWAVEDEYELRGTLTA